MRTSLLLCLAFFIITPIFSTANDGPISTLTDQASDYYFAYSQKEFFELYILDQPIDFNNPDIELLNAAIFHLTNKERYKRKLEPFLFSESLRNCAQFHSEQMRDRRFFSHTNRKNVEFNGVPDRTKYFGYKSGFVGENICKVPSVTIKYNKAYHRTGKKPKYISKPLTYLELAKTNMKLWMHSPGHRANILSDDYIYLGCGNALPTPSSKGSKYVYNLATQNFGGY